MSNASSATIRLSRAFSCSNARSRCASSSFNAPCFDRPPVERLLAAPELLAYLRDRGPLGLQLLRLPQLRHDLLCRELLSRSHQEVTPALSLGPRLSSEMDRESGARTPANAVRHWRRRRCAAADERSAGAGCDARRGDEAVVDLRATVGEGSAGAPLRTPGRQQIWGSFFPRCLSVPTLAWPRLTPV